jgi:threonyl-tRNA synthetase
MPATDSITVTLPDAKTLDLPAGSTPHDVAKSIGEGLAKAAIGARVKCSPTDPPELWDLHRPLPCDSTVALVTAPRANKKGQSKWRDDAQQRDALYLLRHSTAHVMAEAIQRLWPDARLAYGPPLDEGFYYDIALDTPISTDDFERIQAQMQQIVDEARPFTRYELDTDTGAAKLYDEGNKYKIDNASRAMKAGADTLSWYITGEPDDAALAWSKLDAAPDVQPWEDLCQGPHVPDTGTIGAFKLMSVAQSHWHGNVDSDKFQRIYGTAFFSDADLQDHLEKLEQAKARDHRVLGRRLGLFHIDEAVGQGLVLWTPKGAIIRQELQTFISEHLTRQGYEQVFTPHIGKLGLFKTSGHFPYYQDSQYPPLIERQQVQQLAEEGCGCADLANRMEAGEIDGHLLKPMNCPFHIKIYDSQKRSYRDLPLRLAEFGTVYRWEQSGELGGLTRVRGFTQDDAHLFVTPDQLSAELDGCLELVKIVFRTLGMDSYRVRVGLRDPDSTKYVGNPDDWDAAEQACIAAAKALGVDYSEEPGEAAFYGPKIDFVVKDVIGREWQLGTVQVDYQLPQRFDLNYVGADNTEHRPVMIHRAPFGSMERFVGVLIEHFNGAFPLWLSPEQVRVLPVSDKFNDYAGSVVEALKGVGLRASMDDSNDRLGGKIARAEQDKLPYMLVVGGKDRDAGTVSVRHRVRGDEGAHPLAELVGKLARERDERAV